MHIFSEASAKGKRVQSNMGTKNHDVVMQDVHLEATLNTIVGAAF
jgi:malonate-semialdehyde dehydrogenase (acetylating)/methylmalonate-semialdehyde dehydrogenase